MCGALILAEFVRGVFPLTDEIKTIVPADVSSPSAVAPDTHKSVPPAQDVSIATATEEKPYQKLDPRAVTVDQISSVIFTIVLSGCVAIGMGIWLLADWPPHFWFWVGIGIAVVVLGFLFWLSFAYPVADHRHYFWRLDESGLEIRKGIFWRREITVPRARVQHTDVQQGPLQRQYGIAKLVIHTAGTEAASIELSGLSLPIAKWLRDELIIELRGKSDAV